MIITPFVFALWFLFLFELDYTYKNQYNFDEAKHFGGVQLHNVLIFLRDILTCLTVNTAAKVNITIFFLYK